MTQTEAEATSITQATTVDAPIEHVFQLFTDGIGSWWDPNHHLIEGPIERMVFEPRVGGAIYDVGADGSECRWARVLAYDPPDRVLFTWDIGLDWKIEPDPAKASEVEVRFSAEGTGRTRVELTHSHLDRHGPGWESMREAVASPGGWPAGIERFAAELAAPTRDVVG
ncbi:MAG TPA: SRPBCC family protein [Solirubrobacterales bacterium]|nr:SRPBCC family protein [Solirubrobacterales bacterium]